MYPDSISPVHARPGNQRCSNKNAGKPISPAVFVLTWFLCIAALRTSAQAIDYTPSYRSSLTENSFRISYENDFFSASDRDYTQGVYLELIHPALNRSFLSLLTWQPNAAEHVYGIAIETDGYTPNHIDKTEIQLNDRPYASTLMFRTFNIAIDPVKKIRISNNLALGVLGPWAGGKEIQTGIHQWIGYTKPRGWHNQVKNEPIINYQLSIEKELAGDQRHYSVSAIAIARAGTLNTKAGVGMVFATGAIPGFYRADAPGKKKLNLYVYDQPMVHMVGYDATMQGGLLNRSSPYTLPASALNRIVFQNRFGLVLGFRNIMLEYWQSFITREYKTGIEPKTGGVQIAVRL